MDDSLTVFNYSLNGDSLFYEGQYCRVIDTINVKYNGTLVSLFISDFDEINSSDEESYLFWNPSYGLVGQYNLSMGPLLLFEPSDLGGFSTELYDYVVTREKSRRKE